jgi:NAD+ kinase
MSQEQPSRLIVYGNPAKPNIAPVLERLLGWCRERGARLSVSGDLIPLIPGGGLDDKGFEAYASAHGASCPVREGEQTLLVCLGGDGTLIHAVRRFWPANPPVLPVHLGSLGFNASVEPGQLGEALDAWIEGRVHLSERMLIRVILSDGRQVLADTVAVNDVVLAKRDEARVIHLTLHQDGELISSFTADGLIVSTPTGSTAYNLSAGGPIVYPTIRAMIATAICPHTLADRPVVLPPHPAVSMRFTPHYGVDRAILWVDGQDQYPMSATDVVTLEATAEPLRLVTLPGAQYFTRLRRKLCWSGDLPDEMRAGGCE